MIKVIVDRENKCEECWDLFRKLEPDNPLNDFDVEGFIKESTWAQLKKCPHGAPYFAPSIFIKKIMIY